jgi:hypothetical protein
MNFGRGTRKMMRLVIIISLFLFSTVSDADAQSDRWRRILPLESTRSDVERILGQNGDGVGYSLRYIVEEGFYDIKYSDGKCVTKWREEWNARMPELPPGKEGEPMIDWKAAEWTVLSISYNPDDDLSLSALGINLKRLKKESNQYSHTPGIYNYTDVYNGITYEVDKYYDSKTKLATNFVAGIRVKPGKKHKHLLCKKDGE